MPGKKIVVFLMVGILTGIGGYCAAQSTPSQAASSGNSNDSGNGAATYVGWQKCKTCHAKEYATFEKRNYSKSWKILVMRGETKNPECLKCHTTGYGRPGGFISAEKTPNLEGKQCEACHGPGSKHAANPSDPAAKSAMIVANKKNVCIQCHLCMTTHDTVTY